MQNGDEVPAPAENTKKAVPEEVTKQSFRLKIWRHLESSGLAMFPRPVYNRIPNFKGAQEAATKLAELDVFKNATSIKVNPDKPQEPVRVICLEQKKTLYVPVPRLETGFLNRLELPEGSEGPAAIRKAVSRNGMETYGKPIGIEDSVSLDLVVMGSVAVSKEGYRIGKGRGYGDLEFGLMMHMKAIKPNTIVVTTVHDCQVYDTLPAELFGPHDVPIDIIVTPTQVIETQRMSQRPDGILWHLLSNRRIQLMPILGQLREIEMLAGRVCALKEVDTDVEERGATRPRRMRRRTRSHKSQSEGEGNTTEGEGEGKSTKPRRQQRRRSNKSASKEPKDKDKDGKEIDAKPKRNKRPRPVIDFTVKISNISPNTRVRDLKQALGERGVKPQVMVWKGFRGFCYLHFFKPSPQKGEGDTAAAHSMESVLTALAAMSVGGSGATDNAEEKPRVLQVEPAPPRPDPQHTQPQPAPEVCIYYTRVMYVTMSVGGSGATDNAEEKPRVLQVEPAPPRPDPQHTQPQPAPEVCIYYTRVMYVTMSVGGSGATDNAEEKPRVLQVEPAPPRPDPQHTQPQPAPEVCIYYTRVMYVTMSVGGSGATDNAEEKPRVLQVEPAPPRPDPQHTQPQPAPEVCIYYTRVMYVTMSVGGSGATDNAEEKPRVLQVEPAPPRPDPQHTQPQPAPEVCIYYTRVMYVTMSVGGSGATDNAEEKPRVLQVEPAPPRPDPQHTQPQPAPEVCIYYTRVMYVTMSVGGSGATDNAEEKPRVLQVEPAPPRPDPQHTQPQPAPEVCIYYTRVMYVTMSVGGSGATDNAEEKPRVLQVEPAPPRPDPQHTQPQPAPEVCIYYTRVMYVTMSVGGSGATDNAEEKPRVLQVEPAPPRPDPQHTQPQPAPEVCIYYTRVMYVTMSVGGSGATDNAEEKPRVLQVEPAPPRPDPQHTQPQPAPEVCIYYTRVMYVTMSVGGSGATDNAEEKPRVLQVEPAPPRPDPQHTQPQPAPEVCIYYTRVMYVTMSVGGSGATDNAEEKPRVLQVEPAPPRPDPQHTQPQPAPEVCIYYTRVMYVTMSVGGSGATDNAEEKPRVLQVEPAPPRPDPQHTQPQPAPEVCIYYTRVMYVTMSVGGSGATDNAEEKPRVLQVEPAPPRPDPQHTQPQPAPEVH